MPDKLTTIWATIKPRMISSEAMMKAAVGFLPVAKPLIGMPVGPEIETPNNMGEQENG